MNWDHFRLLAPIYDHLIPAPNPATIAETFELPCNGLLLDAGGGTGRVSRQLIPYVKHVVIADMSHFMLKRARGSVSRIRTLVATLPFADQKFHRIIVVDAFHHFQRQSDSMAELVRVLVPGGKIIISEPDISHTIIKLVALMEKTLLMGSTFHSAENLAMMMQAQGLTTRITHNDRLSFCVVGEKPYGTQSITTMEAKTA